MIIDTENSIRVKDTKYRHISYGANLSVQQSTANISTTLQNKPIPTRLSIQDRAADIKIDASQLS